MAAYLRKIAIDGYIIQVDHTDIKAMHGDNKIGSMQSDRTSQNANGKPYIECYFLYRINLHFLLPAIKYNQQASRNSAKVAERERKNTHQPPAEKEESDNKINEICHKTNVDRS